MQHLGWIRWKIAILYVLAPTFLIMYAIGVLGWFGFVLYFGVFHRPPTETHGEQALLSVLLRSGSTVIHPLFIGTIAIGTLLGFTASALRTSTLCLRRGLVKLDRCQSCGYPLQLKHQKCAECGCENVIVQ